MFHAKRVSPSNSAYSLTLIGIWQKCVCVFVFYCLTFVLKAFKNCIKMFDLKAWDHARTFFRSEKLHLSYPKVDIGTNNYMLVVFLVGELINCMYSLYVFTVCLHSLFSLHASIACSHCMYSLYVFIVCIHCTYSLYVFITCIHCMYPLYVLSVCTDCMSSLYIQDKNTDAKRDIVVIRAGDLQHQKASHRRRTSSSKSAVTVLARKSALPAS